MTDHREPRRISFLHSAGASRSGPGKNIRAMALRGPSLRAGTSRWEQVGCAADDQERESSESPMLNAFWRVAPSVLLNFLAIRDALAFLRAIVFSSRTSAEVHARRFFFLFAIKPPFQESQLVSLTGANEKPTDGVKTHLAVEPLPHCRAWNFTATTRSQMRQGELTNAFVGSFLARRETGGNSSFRNATRLY